MSIVLTAPSVTVPSGTSQVDVTVTVGSCPQSGISSLVFTTRVVGASIVSGEAAPSLPDAAHAVVGPTAKSARNGVKFMWTSASSALTDDTEVVTFRVKLPDDCVEGDRFEITVSPSPNRDDFISPDGATGYSATGVSGEIVIGEPGEIAVGDVDGDGRINAADVIGMMRYLAGWRDEGFLLDKADYTGDGRFNARDVLTLMFAIVDGEV